MLPLDEKLAHLEEILRPMGQVLVGYSGGVDSATLAVAAQRVLGAGAICVTADSESYATGELEKATEITREFGIRHEVVKTRELDNPDYAKNAPNRCYYCKQELFTYMEELARTLNVDYILYGQNADDIGDFRPGAAAAHERGVHAPLAEAGLTKDDVRALAKRWGLAVWGPPGHGLPLVALPLRHAGHGRGPAPNRPRRALSARGLWLCRGSALAITRPCRALSCRLRSCRACWATRGRGGLWWSTCGKLAICKLPLICVVSAPAA